MAKVKEGDICIVDPYNLMGNKANSISSVIVLRLAKPAFISSNNMWRCCVNYYGTAPVTNFQGYNQINEDYCLDIQEKFLYPVNGLDKAIILRYPDDAPEFTGRDLDAVKFAIEALDRTADRVTPTDKQSGDDLKRKSNWLRSLAVKMNYYLKRREV